MVRTMPAHAAITVRWSPTLTPSRTHGSASFDRDAAEQMSPRSGQPWSAHLLRAHVLDREPGVGDELVYLADKVAAAGDALLNAVEPVLPASGARLGEQAVLEEVEPAAGPKDPMQFA